MEAVRAGGHVGGAGATLLQEHIPPHDRIPFGRGALLGAVAGAQDHHPLQFGHLVPGGHSPVEQAG